MSHYLIRSGLLPLLLFASSAFAGQSNTPIGFGFVNVCAGNQIFGGLPNPGDGFSASSDQYVNCSTLTGLAASAGVSNSGVGFGGAAYSNSASAGAGPGFADVFATNTGSPQDTFPGASAYAGWNDQITIGNGTGTSVWEFPLVINADLTSTGGGGLARMGFAVYQNYNFVTPYGANNAAYNKWLADNGGASGVRNSVIAFSWDYEGFWFGADASTQNYSVNRTVWFAVPFTYGVPFELGIYMGGVAGESGSGCCGNANTTTLDPPSLVWGGPGVVTDPNTNTVNPNYTISSQSGFNYAPTGAPEPSNFVMVAGGLFAAGWLLRRRSPLP